MRKNTKRSAVIAGVATVIIGGGVAAWAANGWTIGGEGEGKATAATITQLKAESDMGDVKVYPGLVARVNVTVNNPNDFPIKTTDELVKPTGVTVTGGTNADKCQTALMTTPNALTAKFDANAIVKKKDKGTVGSTVTIGDLPMDCVGGKFTVKYTFNAVSTA